MHSVVVAIIHAVLHRFDRPTIDGTNTGRGKAKLADRRAQKLNKKEQQFGAQFEAVTRMNQSSIASDLFSRLRCSRRYTDEPGGDNYCA
jgi:hypothetical protein